MLLADGAAHEAVAVEDADLREVARVEADRDGLADEARQGGADVAQALEADAVALDHARLGVLDQEEVEFLQALGQARQEAACGPGLARRGARLRVGAGVVGADDEGADHTVELGQRQGWRGRRATADEVAGQLGQQLRRDGAKEPLHLAAPLGPGHGRVDQADAQVGRDLLEVAAGEVGAVVDVEGIGDAAHGPGGVLLAPDRLAQRERSVERRGSAQEDHVARDGPRVVVDDRREPRPRGLASLVQDQDVEQRVVGLPEGVRRLGSVAVDQLEAVAEGGQPLVSQRHHSRVQGGEDRMHGGVGGDGPALGARDFGRPAMDRGRGPARSPEPQALDQGDELGAQPAPACVASERTGEAFHSIPSVARQPALCGPQGHVCLVGRAREWHLIFERGPEHR